jgi:cytochrome c biogenesis protein CcmG/thiol:disulfide interchange protein DsbE
VQPTQAQPPAPTTEAPKRSLHVPLWIQLPVYLIVAGLLVLVALQMRRNGPLAAGPLGAGQPAPDFELTTFDGQNYSLQGLRGQVVVVNFWASWCVPCLDEAPVLEAAWRQYKDQGVVFIGVDYVDTETEAKAFLSRFDITYPNGPDLGTKVSQAYRITGVPETYIVGRDGALVHAQIGPIDEAQLRAVLDPLVGD